MEPVCYLNGEIVPVSRAKVGVYDIGLLRGFGVYEALRTFGRKPFMLSAHLARFHASAQAFGLRVPESDERISEIISELLEHNAPPGREALARFILTGGDAPSGLERDPRSSPTFYILVEVLEELPRKLYESGATLIVHEHLREFADKKSTNYIQAVLLQEERKQAGALEILYTYQGRVLECATSNFFIVKNGTLITPKKDVLFGITRQAVIEAVQSALTLEERDVSVDEMYAADEAFLTSSFKDVVPVVKVGERAIGSGTVGPTTRRVMELFSAFTRRA